MKLKKDTIAVISNALTTARIFGIEGFVINDNIVSGINGDSTAVMFSNELELPEDEKVVAGFNRLDILSSRIELIQSTDADYTIDTVNDPRNGNVMQLLMKTKGIKANYRCANPALISHPKDIKDEMLYNFVIPEDVVSTIIRSYSAMRCEKLMILCNNNSISFELEDESMDKCTITTSLDVTSSQNANFA